MVRNIYCFVILIFLLGLNSVQSQDSPVIVNRSTTIEIVDGREYFFHAVLRGQTLFSIARAYGVSVEDIIAENPELQEGELRFDQIIRIPVKKQAPTGEPRTTTVRELTFTEHRVQRRETIYGISRQYNISESELLEHNPEVRTGLRTNMVLKIPRYRDVSQEYIEYLVPPQQTLFSISREYGVTIEDLERLNPQLKKSGLQAGQTLKIPVETGKVVQPPFVYEPPAELPPVYPEEPIAEDPYCENPRLKSHYNVALLIPLYLENFQDEEEVTQQQKEKSLAFLEYYEGLVIALDSVRARGADIRLQVYDVCESEIKARSLIWDSNLGEMDLIIGPFFSNVFPIIANFARDRNIPIVDPQWENRELLRSYPNMFQITPDISTQMKDMATYILEHYPDDNIILVHNNQSGIMNLIADYKNTLNHGLNRYQFYRDSINMTKLDGYYLNGVFVGERITNVFVLNDSLLENRNGRRTMQQISFEDYAGRDLVPEIVYSRDGIEGLKNLMDTNKRNVLVSLMGGEAVITNYTRQLNQLRDTFDMVVFGVPQWREYRSVDVNYMHNLRVHLFTDFFVNYDHRHTIDFIRQYKRYNHVEPGQLGFRAVQTGMFFFTALMQYGTEFPRCMANINQTRPSSNPLLFKRPFGEEGGWENHFVYIFTYRNMRQVDVRETNNQRVSQRQ